MEKGASLLAGDMELYASLIEDYQYLYAGASGSIRVHVKGGEWEVAGKNIHDIKGASGNLSLTRLHRVAVTLEQALKQQDKNPLSAITEMTSLYPKIINSNTKSTTQSTPISALSYAEGSDCTYSWLLDSECGNGTPTAD